MAQARQDQKEGKEKYAEPERQDGGHSPKYILDTWYILKMLNIGLASRKWLGNILHFNLKPNIKRERKGNFSEYSMKTSRGVSEGNFWEFSPDVQWRRNEEWVWTINPFASSFHYSLQVTIKTNLWHSLSTKHRTKSLTHQTGNYPVTCFVSRPSGITLVKFHSLQVTVGVPQ